ncbi:putative reverse transcriptase domain-containing protein [Tanacetum coccineum]
MAGRSTRSNTANNSNPPNKTANEVARQLNTALPNLLTQLVEALEGNRANQIDVTQSCNFKTFRSCGAKEFFGTEGAVGLLIWFKSIESVLYINKCPAESQVKFSSYFKKKLMEEYYPDDEIQKLELEFWNHKMLGSDIDGYTTRFHELARLVPQMITLENQHVNRYIRGLAPEIKANVTSSRPTTIQSDVSMANRLTIDGIKDGIFKKKKNAKDKKRSNSQFKNQGRNDRNKSQRAGRNFALTAPKQGQRQRQYASQHLKCAKCNFHHSSNCPVRNCLRMNQATTSGGNRPNPMLAIKGNPKQGNNRNQARGRAFALGVAEAPQDPNVVMGTFSLNDHFATVLFDSGVDYSFISTNFFPLIDMKTSVISPGYEIEMANGVKVETNKIVRGCRLELEGHTFIIDLIPFGNGSFDVIVEILELHGERPKGNLKQLKTMKVEQKLENIPVVHNFSGVFPEDLSGL